MKTIHILIETDNSENIIKGNSLLKKGGGATKSQAVSAQLSKIGTTITQPGDYTDVLLTSRLTRSSGSVQ